MRAMIFASLALNIAVLVPVCYGIWSNAGWATTVYGQSTPAHGILLSIYIAILLCSIGLLAKPVAPMVASLLLVQILYKVTTPATVGTFAHPVVLSNLAIAAFHSLTLVAIWRGHGLNQ